ncbi:MAG: EpsG family protein [Campylobacterales bacterium]|nr:EpsG family protein [Campylobacterales bacterium]
MAVYLGIFLTTLVNSFFSLVRAFPTREVARLIFILIFLVVGLRYASVDYFSYLTIYEGVTSFSNLGVFIYPVSESTPVESGFAALILLEKLLYGNFFAFVLIFSMISIAIKYYTFSKLSPYLLLSILIYLSDEFFWKDLGQIRNAMAAGILLLSVIFAYERKPVKFFFLLFIATLFHSAAIIGFIIYYLRYVARPFLMAAALIVATLIAAVGGIGLLLPDIASAFGFGDSTRLVKYVDSKYVDGIGAFGGTFMLHILLASLMIYFYRPLIKKWTYNSVLIPMYVYGTVLMFSFIDYGIIAGRIREMIAVPALVIVLPSFILLFRRNQRLVPYAAIVSYCLLWIYIETQNREPYQSILQFI